MSTDNLVIFSRDDLDLIVSFAGCSLDESPGKNWVEGVGGLPEYICQIARAIKRTGKTTSQAISIAVSRVKKWAAGADGVDADTRAKAAKAVAQWEAKKVANKAKKGAKKAANAGDGKRDRDTVRASHTDTDVLCLAKVEYNVDMVRSAFEAQTRKARTAWRAANPTSTYDDGPSYLYVKEMWTSHLIVTADSYRGDGKLYKVPYSVDAANNVTFSDPVEVKTEYVVVKESDIGGDELSDSDLQKMMDLCGPCTSSAVDQVLSLSAPLSPLELVLRAVERTKR